MINQPPEVLLALARRLRIGFNQSAADVDASVRGLGLAPWSQPVRPVKRRTMRSRPPT